MQLIMMGNKNESKSALGSNEVAAKNKTARNSQWQVRIFEKSSLNDMTKI